MALPEFLEKAASSKPLGIMCVLMACDKGSRISSALQTKQGTRSQVKQKPGFYVGLTGGLETAQPLGRPDPEPPPRISSGGLFPFAIEDQTEICPQHVTTSVCSTEYTFITLPKR